MSKQLSHIEKIIEFYEKFIKEPQLFIAFTIVAIISILLYFSYLSDFFGILLGITSYDGNVTEMPIESYLLNFNIAICLFSFVIFITIIVIDFIQIKGDIQDIKKKPFIFQQAIDNFKETRDTLFEREREKASSILDAFLIGYILQFINSIMKYQVYILEFLDEKIKNKQYFIIMLLYQIVNYKLKFLIMIIPILILLIEAYLDFYWYEIILVPSYFPIISLIVVIISLIILKSNEKINIKEAGFSFLSYVFILPFIEYITRILF